MRHPVTCVLRFPTCTIVCRIFQLVAADVAGNAWSYFLRVFVFFPGLYSYIFRIGRIPLLRSQFRFGLTPRPRAKLKQIRTVGGSKLDKFDGCITRHRLSDISEWEWEQFYCARNTEFSVIAGDVGQLPLKSCLIIWYMMYYTVAWACYFVVSKNNRGFAGDRGATGWLLDMGLSPEISLKSQ